MHSTLRPLALFVALYAVFPAPAAIAQSVADSARVRIEQPAQPLASAIAALSQQTGTEIFAPGALVADRQAPALSGQYSARDALVRLLAGSGLTAERQGASLVVRKDVSAATAPATLATVTVQATPETATGPVGGIVAHRSGTATRTDTPLVETPQSVSVVTREQIEATRSVSVADALAYTPGVASQSPNFTRMVDDVNIRGFNVANGNTGMLRDGLKLQSNVYDGGQEPYGLERLEVLRGAASVLYGQLGPGGVVNAVSKRPTLDPLHELSIEAGSYGRRQITGDFAGPLTDDGEWSYRLTGLWRDADAPVDHVRDDKRYLAPALTWRPSANTSVTLLASRQEVRSQFSPPMLYSAISTGTIPRDLFIGEPNYDRYDADTTTAGYFIEHRFDNGIKLKHSLRHYKSDATWNYLQYGGLSGVSILRGVSDRQEHSTGLATDTSVEANFQTGLLRHTLLGGIDAYRSTYETHRYGGTVTPLRNIYAPVYGAIPIINRARDNGTRTESEQAGLYLQDQIKLGEKWVVLLGGRQDWVDSESLAFATRRELKRRDHAFTARAGAVYLADNGVAPYASVSQSFAPLNGSSRTGDGFKPTEGQQVELGMRYQPAGTNAMLSAAVFDLRQRNVLTPDPLDSTFSVQTGAVRSRGLELEARAAFGNLDLIAAYAYTDARIRQSNNRAEVGERIALVPYNMMSVWANYRLRGMGLDGLRVGAGVRMQGGANLVGSTAGAPGRTLVDAVLAYDFGAMQSSLAGLEMRMNISNLFDRNYYACAAVDGCRYGDPRTVSATLSYRW